MKRPFLAFLLLIFTLGTSADNDTYNYLTFTTTTGEQSIAVSNLKVTFSGGKLIATNTSTSEAFTLTALTKMYFSNTLTGISEIAADNGNASVEVFSVSGVSLGKYNTLDIARTSLQSGVYVVKSASKTYKITVK
ncbi:MAG: hypothetical protein LKG25_07325 [Prevotella sp.]|jgi:hypothetical protein|nr:hypothetical protein [Prevotella sp.]MCI1282392.1 hypothetical protein [Prevotella sp.]